MIARDGKKMTAKQWVVEVLKGDVELATDYYYEREATDYDKMTDKEKNEISRHYNNFHNRILKMLYKSQKKVKS